MLDPITIVMPTWLPDGQAGEARMKAVEQAVSSWATHLKYDGELVLQVADDGSQGKLGSSQGELVSSWWPGLCELIRNQRKGVGASVNAGARAAFDRSALMLNIVDDWELIHDFDLTPWAKILLANEDVGCIRLGMASPSLRGGKIRLFEEGWTILFERNCYYWCMKPALYHKRFFESYGALPEGDNAFEVDRIYNEHICAIQGPDVLLALFSPFNHLPSVELAHIQPGQEVKSV